LRIHDFSRQAPLTSHLGDDGALRTTITDERASVPPVPVPPGTWTVTAAADQSVELRAMLGKDGPTREASGPLTFTLDRETAVTMEVAGKPGESAAVGAIELRRNPDARRSADQPR
jgi:hypothetical protein